MTAILFAYSNRQHAPVCFIRQPTKFFTRTLYQITANALSCRQSRSISGKPSDNSTKGEETERGINTSL
jgi:hypothetical protein